MADISYQEKQKIDRNFQIRNILKKLPDSCSDFISSITLTTSSLTRLAYAIDLQAFFIFIEKELPQFNSKEIFQYSDSDLSNITVRNIIQFTEYLTLYVKHSQDKKGNELTKVIRNHECGVMRKLSSLRSYFDYLLKCNRISTNPASMVTLPKLHEKPILYLIQSEVEKLLQTAQNGDMLTDTQKRYHKLTKARDTAILMLFLGTGIRISECVGIDLHDLDFTSNALIVTRKGGNQTILYFPDEVANALSNYIILRKQIEPVLGHENALFLSLQKKRLSNRAVQLMVKKYSTIAVPLKRRMSPHKLRSTFATRLYHETEDIYLVADVLGHSDINTTRKHYAAMSDKRRREAAKSVHLPSTSNDDELI